MKTKIAIALALIGAAGGTISMARLINYVSEKTPLKETQFGAEIWIVAVIVILLQFIASFLAGKAAREK